MSPGDNTAVMNSETKQTKRGRLKQEAQHRYRFFCNTLIPQAAMLVALEKNPSHINVQII